jgi:hypothetical protein
MTRPVEILIQSEDRYCLIIMDLKIEDFMNKYIILSKINVKLPFLLGTCSVDFYSDDFNTTKF